MKLFKNRFFIAAICILLAAVVAVVALPKLYRDEGATTQIVQVSVNVPMGTRITEQMLTTTTVGAYNLSPAAIKDKSLVVGRYAKTDLLPSDILVAEKLSASPLVTDQTASYEYELKSDEYLISVAIPNQAAGVCGMLAKDSFVTVAYHNASRNVEENAEITDETEEGEEPAEEIPFIINPLEEKFYEQCIVVPELLRDLRIYSIKNNSLQDIDQLRDSIQAGELAAADANLTPAYITFVVTEEQAKAMIGIHYDYAFYLIYDMNTTEQVEADRLAEIEAQKAAQEQANEGGVQ